MADSLAELQKQLAASQAQYQQLQAQVARMSGGQPGANPYSIATQRSTGAKTAADAADTAMPQAPTDLTYRPDPRPSPSFTPPEVEMSPEEERYRRTYGALANIGAAERALEAGRPRGRVVTSSRMPRDPYDEFVNTQMKGIIARELGGLGGIGGMPNIERPQDPQNGLLPRDRSPGAGSQLIPLTEDRADAAFNRYLTSSPADRAKLDARATEAGMDPRSFLSLTSLSQFNAVSANRQTPSPVRTSPTSTAQTMDGSAALPTGSTASTRTDARGVQITNYPSGAVTMVGPGVRGAGVPASSPRQSSEIARELTYRSNLAGAALGSLRRPAARFGF